MNTCFPVVNNFLVLLKSIYTVVVLFLLVSVCLSLRLWAGLSAKVMSRFHWNLVLCYNWAYQCWTSLRYIFRITFPLPSGKRPYHRRSHRRGAHLPCIGSWTRRWINHYCLWRQTYGCLRNLSWYYPQGDGWPAGTQTFSKRLYNVYDCV